MEYIEVSAKTVDEAITKACISLGKASDELDVQVISEGSSGFFGFGSKPAVIKVCVKEETEETVVEPEVVKETEKVPVVEEIKEEVKEVKAPKENKKKEPKAPKKNNSQPKKDAKKDNKKETQPEKKQPEKKPVPVFTEEEVAKMSAAAIEFLDGTFKAMGINAVINSEYEASEACLNINFEGAEMGVLIGKRGQTLDSLQYLTSLVINKENKEYIRVKLDTEDYRRRRKDTLENLAKNIASKVKKTRRPVVLEPMNPYERRIIHSALQNTRGVETYSEGNEPYRHIVVKPSKQQ